MVSSLSVPTLPSAVRSHPWGPGWARRRQCGVGSERVGLGLGGLEVGGVRVQAWGRVGGSRANQIKGMGTTGKAEQVSVAERRERLCILPPRPSLWSPCPSHGL